MSLFRKFGEIQEFKVLTGKDGKNIGSGFVTLSSIEESSLAMHKL